MYGNVVYIELSNGSQLTVREVVSTIVIHCNLPAIVKIVSNVATSHCRLYSCRPLVGRVASDDRY